MRTRYVWCAVLAAMVATPSSLFADFSYQETNQMTGGALLGMMRMAGMLSSQAHQANQPIQSYIYLKGNRMARVSPQSIEITDLDKDTITHIDPVKHTYTVTTFEQMKEQLAEARRQMENKQAEQPTAQNPDAQNVQMSFDARVRKTGAAKQVSGLDTSEAILTLMMNATDTQTAQKGSMGITNDMWLAPEVPGYDQVREFSKRMAERMGEVFADSGFNMSRMLAGQPGATQALADLAKEMQEVQGVPVLQVMRMGTTTDGQPLAAASEAPLPANSGPQMPSAGDVAKQGAASEIASHLGGFGGFGGFGHKKPASPPADQPPPDGQAAQPASAVLLELQTESSNFSTEPVDESHFQIPGGYQQVQPEMHHAEQ
ncbi:MAG TPA: hypothetical protein VGM27_31880 [Acidobacteriaceae bacterium]